MKVELFILISVGILNACAARGLQARAAADEKKTAIAEIEKKFNEVEKLGKQVKTAVDAEKTTAGTSTGEKDTLNQLLSKVNSTKLQVEDDAKAVIRTAIVQSKPMAVIYCIRTVTFSATVRFQQLSDINSARIKEIKAKKLQKIAFDEYAVGAITSGLKELIEQSKAKINEGTIPQIQASKKEALTHCSSAELLLGEIEVCVNEPVLTKEYIKMRQEIDRSLTNLKNNLNSELQDCLRKTPPQL